MSAALVKEARGLVSDPPKETQMPMRLFSSWLAGYLLAGALQKELSPNLLFSLCSSDAHCTGSWGPGAI